MTDMARRNRVQSGVPTGGEFATGQRGENPDLLADALNGDSELPAISWIDKVEGRLVVRGEFGEMPVHIQNTDPEGWLEKNAADLRMLYTEAGIRAPVTIRENRSSFMAGARDMGWRALVGHNGSTDLNNESARMTFTKTLSGSQGWDVGTPSALTSASSSANLDDAVQRCARNTDFARLAVNASSDGKLGRSLFSTRSESGDSSDTVRLRLHRSGNMGPIEAVLVDGKVTSARNVSYDERPEVQVYGGFASAFGMDFRGRDDDGSGVRERIEQLYADADGDTWRKANLN